MNPRSILSNFWGSLHFDTSYLLDLEENYSASDWSILSSMKPKPLSTTVTLI